MSDSELPNVFNYFYAHFDRYDFLENIFLLKHSLVSEANIMISLENVTALLKHINPNKSPGPNGRLLIICSHIFSQKDWSLTLTCLTSWCGNGVVCVGVVYAQLWQLPLCSMLKMCLCPKKHKQ